MSMPPLPGNFGRAFDLSSLTKPKVESVSSSTALEATVENFITDFVSISKEKPVVLLAYSQRSPASVELRDLMAEMSLTDKQSWLFGGIDADAQPQLAQALQIPSIPYAIAFIAEQPLALFDRPYPQEQIAMVIAKLFEMAKEKGLSVEIPEAKEIPLEPEEAAALAALESGDYSGAAMAYRNWLQRKPDELMAKIGLAQCELMVRISELDPQDTIKQANQEPASVEKQIKAADIEIAQGQIKSAFDRLINVVRTSDGDAKKLAKEHLLLLFQLVDPSEPDLIRARTELASALF
ncbi:MAG: tetratricopeptide repeat protein [Candidatus Nanopelagicaceae bacterium]|nr:tetratricopeptide repeat protein [Candidatus Nanopelagicaceae bacterium]